MIIDLKRNASPEEISQGIDEMQLSWLNGLLTKMIFRTFLLRSAYTRTEFVQMASDAGVGLVQIEENYMGLEITISK